MSVALLPGSSRLELAATFGAELHAARVRGGIASLTMSDLRNLPHTLPMSRSSSERGTQPVSSAAPAGLEKNAPMRDTQLGLFEQVA